MKPSKKRKMNPLEKLQRQKELEQRAEQVAFYLIEIDFLLSDIHAKQRLARKVYSILYKDFYHEAPRTTIVADALPLLRSGKVCVDMEDDDEEIDGA